MDEFHLNTALLDDPLSHNEAGMEAERVCQQNEKPRIIIGRVSISSKETAESSDLPMRLLVSVIIPTHNPRPNILQRTLAALAGQTLERTEWELLIVDNASIEQTASRFDLTWHPHARHIAEPSIGLTHARLAGIAAARSELIVFVDDDNVLASDYLTHAIEIARTHPFLGVWGGSITGEFAQPPAGWSESYLPMLAVRSVQQDIWSNSTSGIDHVPFGAGMCVRLNVARHYAEVIRTNPQRLSLDRVGTSLSSCGDLDLAFTACDMGLGTGLFARLQLKHLIPTERLTVKYFVRLAEAVAFSNVLLHFFRSGKVSPTSESRSERLFRLYREWRMPAPRRRIEQAYRKGHEKAVSYLLKRSSPA